jgi:hypothetical protein
MEKENIIVGKYWWSSIECGFDIGPFDTLEECFKHIESNPDQWINYCINNETDNIPIGITDKVYDTDKLVESVKGHIKYEAMVFNEDYNVSFTKNFDKTLKDLFVNDVHFGVQTYVKEIGYYNVKTHKFEKED